MLWTGRENIRHTWLHLDRRRRTLTPRAKSALHAPVTTLFLASTTQPSKQKVKMKPFLCKVPLCLFGLQSFLQEADHIENTQANSTTRKFHHFQSTQAIQLALLLWTDYANAFTAFILISSVRLPSHTLPLKRRKIIACDVSDTFATHASLVHDAIDTDCLAQNGSTHGRIFSSFQRNGSFRQRKSESKRKPAVALFLFFIFLNISFLSICPYPSWLGAPLKTRLEHYITGVEQPTQ